MLVAYLLDRLDVLCLDRLVKLLLALRREETWLLPGGATAWPPVREREPPPFDPLPRTLFW